MKIKEILDLPAKEINYDLTDLFYLLPELNLGYRIPKNSKRLGIKYVDSKDKIKTGIVVFLVKKDFQEHSSFAIIRKISLDLKQIFIFDKKIAKKCIKWIRNLQPVQKFETYSLEDEIPKIRRKK